MPGSGRGGEKPYFTIGRYGALTADQARREAKKLLGQIAAGEDPAEKRKAARAAFTVAHLAEEYLAKEVRPKRKPKTVKLYEHYVRFFINDEKIGIGKLKAEKVTKPVISKLHLKIGETRAVSANRVLDTVSGIFSFGEENGLLPPGFVNPAKGVTKFAEQGRERFLTTEEFKRLGAAIREAETVGVPWDVDEAKSGKQQRRRSGSSFLPAAGCAKSFTSNGPRSTSSAACSSSATPRRAASPSF